MSFAEGFGSAFSKSFNAGLEREEEKKKDAFRIAYADLIERRKDTQAKKDKDEAQVRQAKALTGLAGQSEDNWPTVYNMLSSGVSADKIREDIETGTFSPIGGSSSSAPASTGGSPKAPEAPKTPTPEAAFPTPGLGTQPQGDATPPAAPASTGQNQESIAPGEEGFVPPEAAPQAAPAGKASIPPYTAQDQSAKAPMDQQMQGTGMAPAPAPQAPAPAAAPAKKSAANITGLLSNLSGKFKGGSKPAPTAVGAQAPAGASEAYNRIGAATGKTGDQIAAEVNQTYTPGQNVPQPVSKFTPAPAARKANPMADIDAAFSEQFAAADAAARNPQDASAQARLANANRDLKAAQASVAFKSDAKARSEGNNASLTGIPGIVVNDQTGQIEPVSAKMTEQGYRNTTTDQPISGRFVPYSPEEYKEVLDMGKQYAAGVADTAKRSAKIVPMLRSAGIMSQLVDETNGQVLHDWTAGAARGLVSGAKDIGNSIDLINSAANADGIVPPQAIETLRAQVEEAGQTDLATFLGPDINNLAAKSALFEAQKTLLAYDMAAANGQTGQGLSNKDFQVMKETVAGAVDAPNFKQKLANVIGQQISSIESGASEAIGFNARVAAFEALGKKTPYDPVEVDVGKLIQQSNDPQVLKGWSIVQGMGGNPTGKGIIDKAAGNQGTTPPPAGASVDTSKLPVMNTPEEAAKLPSGTSFRTPDGRIKVRP